MFSKSRMSPRESLPRSRRLLLTCFVAGVFALGTAVPSQAVTFDGQSSNWAGAIGKPITIGSEPVTKVYMQFRIPVLDCKQDGYISIWIGMDSASDQPGDGVTPRLDQTGLFGQCAKGKATWKPFYEAYPAVNVLYMEGLPDLRAGQLVSMHLDYVPYTAPDAFIAEIIAQDDPNTPQSVAAQTFYSPSGAAQRDRGECIVERPSVNGTYKPLPRFTAVGGGDMTARCDAGTIPEGAGICSIQSNCFMEDMYATRFGVFKKKLVDASNPDPNSVSGTVNFHWLAVK